MKHPKGIWLRRGLLPYYLTGHRLALALLLRDKPSTAAQLAAALTEKGYRTTPQTLEKSLARLTRLGTSRSPTASTAAPVRSSTPPNIRSPSSSTWSA